MSTQYRIRYSPAALDDLKDIFAYIATELRSPENASKQIHRINEEICSLDFMPCRNEQVDWEPWKSMGMRKVPVNHFVVFYAVDQKLMVVTVIRTRSPPACFPGIAPVPDHKARSSAHRSAASSFPPPS